MPIILYQKDFPLGEGVSFLDFLKALDEKYYVNYGIVIDKTPTNDKCRFELVTHVPVLQWGWENMFAGKVLLSEGEILYSKKSGHFTIRAWSKGWNTVNAFLYAIMPLFLLPFGLYMTISRGHIGDAILLIIILLLFASPVISIYLRDRDILNRIGSLGTTLENK
jgi:hypothetical protein